jgi:phosphoglycerate dehydrogenase-like enzyme
MPPTPIRQLAVIVELSPVGFVRPKCRHAAVDVYEQEPVVNGNHPLLSMPNVLCTPHLGWAEWQNFELYFRETFEQIVAFEQGEPLRLRNPDVRPRA